MSKKKVKKAIIPAAGFGTRFLPATKSVPKELLPIVDTPTIQLIVEEVARANIETLVLITGKAKYSIRDHFDYNRELENKLIADKKEDLARRLHEMCDIVEIVSVRQQEQKGLGHAIWCARNVIGDEPFAVLLGDDLVLNGEVPCTKQMTQIYEKYGKSVVGLMEVDQIDVNKFGICSGKVMPENPRCINAEIMVEKPAVDKAPSRDAIVGRYVLSPSIFPILDEMVNLHETGAGGEIQLTDALAKLMIKEGVIGYKFEGERYDAGSKDGWLMANICQALKDPKIARTLVPYMEKVLLERK
jgi:UTP--glucose-1-phosphate uridylyltransferase